MFRSQVGSFVESAHLVEKSLCHHSVETFGDAPMQVDSITRRHCEFQHLHAFEKRATIALQIE